MTTMFIRHSVNDFSQWKRAYDDLAGMRQAKGVTAASLHRDANDANTIIVTHRFQNLDAARAFANSEDLKAAMMEAGVSGPPEFWFGEEL